MKKAPEKKIFPDLTIQEINAATARRVSVVRHMKMGSEPGARVRFAEWLGIEVPRWNNFERGWMVPRLIGHKLCDNIPGMTLDWLFRGREEAVDKRLLRELHRAELEWKRCVDQQAQRNGASHEPQRKSKK